MFSWCFFFLADSMMVKSPLKHSLNVSFEENMFGTFSKQIQRRWVVFSMFGYLLYLRPFGRYEVLVPYKVLVKL